jgi:hypothetical protein
VGDPHTNPTDETAHSGTLVMRVKGTESSRPAALMRVSWAVGAFPGKRSRDDRAPEKRKVGSSTLPLTTREDFVGPFTCGNGQQSGNAAWHRRRLTVQDPHNAPQLAGDGGSYVMAVCCELMQYLFRTSIEMMGGTGSRP